MNTPIERLEEIEKEREQTMLDPNYQKWMNELNISRLHNDRTAIFNARDINEQYDYGDYCYRVKNILQY